GLVAADARRTVPARGRGGAQPALRLTGAPSCRHRTVVTIVSTRQVRVLTEAGMNLKPLEDRIVVRPGESEETTVSGIVIPDTAKEKPQQGEVLAVGPGRRSEQSGELIPVDVKVGDTVVYSKYGGTEITVEGEDLLILTGRDVLAIVDA